MADRSINFDTSTDSSYDCAVVRLDGNVVVYSECVVLDRDYKEDFWHISSVTDVSAPIASFVIFLMQLCIIIIQLVHASSVRKRDKRTAFLDKHFELGVTVPVQHAIDAIDEALNERGKLSNSTEGISSAVETYQKRTSVCLAQCRRHCIEADKYISDKHKKFQDLFYCEVEGDSPGAGVNEQVEDLLVELSPEAALCSTLKEAATKFRRLDSALQDLRVNLRRTLKEVAAELAEG